MAFVNTPALSKFATGRHIATSPRRTRQLPRAALAPAADRVLVRVDEAANQTGSGLFLGKEEDSVQRTGTVVAVGPGRFSPEGQLEPIALSPGDRVLWKDDYGSEKIDALYTDGEGPLLALKVFSIVAKF